AVRKDEWKLLYRPEDTSDKAPVAEGDSLFLVNLTHDVGEMKNLAAKEPEKVRELREMYKSWADKYAE
ncbi:MAG: sulfatase, partial [Cyclobacteriaceae bacterium]|nr:sulfatase [Cyclobacteriaceae bacterium]